MADFLEELTKRLEPNPISLKNFKRMYTPKTLHKVEPNSPLETAVLYDRVQVRARLRNRIFTSSSGNVPKATYFVMLQIKVPPTYLEISKRAYLPMGRHKASS